MNLCGAKTRNGSTCKHVAGWGTNHVGVGKCKMHGGSTPIKHGRYSKIKGELAKKMAEHADVENPTDLVPELTILRALLEGWIAKNTSSIETAIPGIITLTDGIRKVVDTINKIQTREVLTANESIFLLITLADVLQTEIAYIRREAINDETALRHIINKLRSRIDLPRQTREQALFLTGESARLLET